MVNSLCRILQVCFDLTGYTHSRFFANTCGALEGASPHVIVDGAPAWNGVREQQRYIFGDPDAITWLHIDDEVIVLFLFHFLFKSVNLVTFNFLSL
jgi:hypothetical protein